MQKKQCLSIIAIFFLSLIISDKVYAQTDSVISNTGYFLGVEWGDSPHFFMIDTTGKEQHFEFSSTFKKQIIDKYSKNEFIGEKIKVYIQKNSSVIVKIESINFQDKNFNSSFKPKIRISGLENNKTYTSLQDAIDESKEEDKILIYPGKYLSDKDIHIRKNKITIIGIGKPEILCNSMKENVFFITSEDVTIRNIEARHLKSDFYANCTGNVFAVNMASNVTIENCDINGCGRIGVYMDGGSNIALKNNYIHNNSLCAYQVDGINYNKAFSSGKIIFKDNIMENNGTIGAGSVFDSLYIVADKLNKSKTDKEIKNNLEKLILIKDPVSVELNTTYYNSYNGDFNSFEVEARKITDKIPALYFSWVEEGTKPYLTLNWNNLLVLARNTKSKKDDNYFSLKKEIYGQSGEYFVRMPIWVIKHTDLSGSSKLGDKTFSYIFKKINSLQIKDKDLFYKEYQDVRNQLIDDLISMSKFEYEKTDTMIELKEIFSFSFLSNNEKEKINKRFQEIKESPNKFQFDCKSGNCTFD